MKLRMSLLIFLVLVTSVSLPARAYADPSGGMLFQILMPMLAALWGMWMIFAQRVRQRMSSIVRKLRGMEPEEPGA